MKTKGDSRFRFDILTSYALLAIKMAEKVENPYIQGGKNNAKKW